MEKIFFDNWNSVSRTLIIGAIAYLALIFMLRISGKRTLSQMKEFDFIVTVALGSTLATVLLSKDVTLASGVAALALLISLQYILAYCSVRSRRFSKLISSEPTLIFYKGAFLTKALKKERVTEAEVRSVLRSQQVADLREVEAVVMESNGQFSVVKNGSVDDPQSPLFRVKRIADDAG
ncbi:DUF421 domain-containing protein [Mucilaginibacter limnophilus]|uniref:DUF421 domain-containing protein n=1 Tax=Mucilaginibacter limnophilus TaxID=1932778 RepID=A0A437MLD2_9SPHI|nr:YetF domain-containing protein [Mucilaginibacter limnophilus]RVT98433.1 DUF421 domain-containing protein [Mucilaginibacter limnophilus]